LGEKEKTMGKTRPWCSRTGVGGAGGRGSVLVGGGIGGHRVKEKGQGYGEGVFETRGALGGEKSWVRTLSQGIRTTEGKGSRKGGENQLLRGEFLEFRAGAFLEGGGGRSNSGWAGV